MIANIFANLIIFLVTLVVVVVFFFQRKFTYWKRKGVPTLNPTIPFGDLQNLLTKKISRMDEFAILYNTAKAKGFKKYCGLYQFTAPTLLVLDLDLIKTICVKDFEHFVDRGFYYNEKDDPMGIHLLAIDGNRWKYARKKISAVFTSSKLKWMFQNMKSSADSLVGFIEQNIEKGNQTMNSRDLVSLHIADSVGSSTLGIECESFTDPDKNFVKYGHKSLDLTRIGQFYLLLGQLFPKLSRRLGIKQLSKDVSGFFYGVITNAINQRRRNNVERSDILQLLMRLEEKGDEKTENIFTFDEVVSHSFGMYIGGLETSTATLSFALYYLAKHKQYQDKARQEIKTVLKKFNNEFIYEAVQEFKYLDQCIKETLRLNPAVHSMNRVCTIPYTIPGEDLVIEKDTSIFITLTGIHRDPDYYERPDEFYPDHFSEENVRNRHPFAHMPFGMGPRECIGKRYGKLQIAATLACIINNFDITVNKKTREPIEVSPSAVIPVARGIYLNFRKID